MHSHLHSVQSEQESGWHCTAPHWAVSPVGNLSSCPAPLLTWAAPAEARLWPTKDVAEEVQVAGGCFLGAAPWTKNTELKTVCSPPRGLSASWENVWARQQQSSRTRILHWFCWDHPGARKLKNSSIRKSHSEFKMSSDGKSAAVLGNLFQ